MIGVVKVVRLIIFHLVINVLNAINGRQAEVEALEGMINHNSSNTSNKDKDKDKDNIPINNSNNFSHKDKDKDKEYLKIITEEELMIVVDDKIKVVDIIMIDHTKVI